MKNIFFIIVLLLIELFWLSGIKPNYDLWKKERNPNHQLHDYADWTFEIMIGNIVISLIWGGIIIVVMWMSF